MRKATKSKTTKKTLISEASKKTKKKAIRDVKGRFAKEQTQTYGYEKYVKGKKFAPVKGLQPGGEKVRSSVTKIFGVKPPKAKAISYHDVDAGDICTFTYRGPMAHDPKPVVLFFSVFEKKLHALNLKYVPPNLIPILSRYVNNNYIQTVHPKTFYDNTMKKWLGSVAIPQDLSLYRAYNIKGVTMFKIYWSSIELLSAEEVVEMTAKKNKKKGKK